MTFRIRGSMERYLDIAENLYLYEGKTIKEAVETMLKIKKMEEENK